MLRCPDTTPTHPAMPRPLRVQYPGAIYGLMKRECRHFHIILQIASLLALLLISGCSTPPPDGDRAKKLCDRVQLGMKRYEVLVILGPPRLLVGNDVYYLPPRPLREYESPQAPARILVQYDQHDTVVRKEFFK